MPFGGKQRGWETKMTSFLFAIEKTPLLMFEYQNSNTIIFLSTFWLSCYFEGIGLQMTTFIHSLHKNKP